MNETPRRPRRRLHAVTWAAIAAAVSLIGVVNLYGVSPIESNALNNGGRWSYGWPKSIMSRFRYRQRPAERLLFAVAIDEFDPAALVADGAVWLAMLFGTAWIVERAMRRSKAPGFSLKSLLAITALAAFLLYGFTRQVPTDVRWFRGATAFCCGGVGLFSLAVFDIFGIAWNRRTSRRHAAKAIDSESLTPGGVSSESAF